MTLRNTLFWRTFALLVLIVALVGASLLYFLHQRYHAVARQETEAYAVFLADQCVRPMLWDDRLQLRSLLTAAAEKGVLEYVWLERHGAPFMHTFTRGVPSGLIGLHPSEVRGVSMRNWQDQNGRIYGDIAVPLPRHADGILHVGFTEVAVN